MLMQSFILSTVLLTLFSAEPARVIFGLCRASGRGGGKKRTSGRRGKLFSELQI
jgi:hypothetical protein